MKTHARSQLKKRFSAQPRQLSLFKPSPRFFGGSLLNGKRRAQRPLSFRRPIHLVVKSSKARGRWSFLDSRNKHKIMKWLGHFAQKNSLRIYEKALVWDHLHLVVRFPDRRRYNSFIRALTGTLPRSVFKFEDQTQSFWDHRPFTRIMDWGRDYDRTCEYLIQNVLESLGLVPYKARRRAAGRASGRTQGRGRAAPRFSSA